MEQEPQIISESRNTKDWYIGIGFLTGVIIFIISWLYCISTYGFLVGVTLGWIPSLIVAAIGGFLWPIPILLLLVFLWLIFRSS